MAFFYKIVYPSSMKILKTPRLILRQWREEDLEAFARLNADSRVMEYFPALFSKEDSDAMARRMQAKIAERGWGFWAVSIPDEADFIGFIGLNLVDDPIYPFAPAVEIGWRLAHDYWGKGYATEGAKAALQFGFETLHLPEIVAFTAAGNARSRNVMEKIGMKRNPADDFEHPNIKESHPLRAHVLYRKS